LSTLLRVYLRWVAALFLTLPAIAFAQLPEVVLAGLSYSGDAESSHERFRYSTSYIESLQKEGVTPYTKLIAALSNHPPSSIAVSQSQITNLQGRDQAIVVSLVVTSEIVSVERFGLLNKLMVLIRGQALFFDFKSMTVLRAYPLSFAFIDSFDREPTEAEKLGAVRKVYEGTQGKPGIYERFARALSGAALPTSTSRYLKVTNVSVAADVAAALPAYLTTSEAVTQTWAADMVGEAISTQVGVPIVPFIKGAAIGNVMSVQIADGAVYNLKLPSPDYEISVDLTSLKKIKYGESAAGESFIYGSYATVRIEEPLSGTTYFNTTLKNGEMKIVPRTQNVVDDFPAYYDSLNRMFTKLAQSFAGGDTKWVQSAAGAKDVTAQIVRAKDLLNSCK